ncbi:MAG: hypothetical protein B7Z82_07645, partial [Halothiobacillus sp. 20-54-6]
GNKQHIIEGQAFFNNTHHKDLFRNENFVDYRDWWLAGKLKPAEHVARIETLRYIQRAPKELTRRSKE